MSADKTKTVLNYEQSAGEGYEDKLGGLHSDSERMEKLLIPIREYIHDKGLVQITIADLGGGTGNLVKFIKNQLTVENPDLEIAAISLDINPRQLEAVEREYVQPVLGDIESLPLHDIDVGLSRNVYHYLSLESQRTAAGEAYKALKKGGMYLNAFVSTSPESQEAINDFWTKFATMVNLDKEKTERYFATQAQMLEIFSSVGFKNVQFKDGFENIAVVNGLNGLAGKYPSLTPEEIKEMETHLLSFPEMTKAEFSIRPLEVVVDGQTLRTVSISQPVRIIYGEKPLA